MLDPKWFEAGGGILGGIGGVISGIRQNNLSREQFDYQKQLNNLQMEREDNAVSRYARQLEENNLSKTLAAGGQAQTSSYRSAEAPRESVFERTLKGLDLGRQIMEVSQGNAEVENRKANTGLIKAQSLATILGGLRSYQEALYTYKHGGEFKMPVYPALMSKIDAILHDFLPPAKEAPDIAGFGVKSDDVVSDTVAAPKVEDVKQLADKVGAGLPKSVDQEDVDHAFEVLKHEVKEPGSKDYENVQDNRKGKETKGYNTKDNLLPVLLPYVVLSLLSARSGGGAHADAEYFGDDINPLLRKVSGF